MKCRVPDSALLGLGLSWASVEHKLCRGRPSAALGVRRRWIADDLQERTGGGGWSFPKEIDMELHLETPGMVS